MSKMSASCSNIVGCGVPAALKILRYNLREGNLLSSSPIRAEYAHNFELLIEIDSNRYLPRYPIDTIVINQPLPQ